MGELIFAVCLIALLFAIGATLAFAFLVYYILGLLVLVVIQFIFAKVVKGTTGIELDLEFTAVGLGVETAILIVLVAAYAMSPANPVKVEPEKCVEVYQEIDSLEFNVDYPMYGHKETVTELVEAFQNLEVTRTLPTTIKYAYPNAKTGRKFYHLYFFGENGEFLQKICVYDDLIGVSDKIDGKYKYYNTKETIGAEKMLKDIERHEYQLDAEDKYGEKIQQMQDSFRYENGTYTFTVPEFDASYLNIEIIGDEFVYYSHVNRANGVEISYRTSGGAIYYLKEHTDAEDWKEGQEYSFTLNDTTYRGVFCRVYVNAGKFQFDIPLIDQKYVYSDENKVITYIDY